jgi:hypothetical protein
MSLVEDFPRARNEIEILWTRYQSNVQATKLVTDHEAVTPNMVVKVRRTSSERRRCSDTQRETIVFISRSLDSGPEGFAGDSSCGRSRLRISRTLRFSCITVPPRR